MSTATDAIPTTTGSAPTGSTTGRTTPPVIPRRGFGFALTGVSVLIMMTGASAPSPFYPLLQERLGIGPIGVTVAFAVYAVALLVALLTVGSLSDHVGRRPLIMGGFVLLAVSVLLLWHVDSGGVLDLARILQGFASGALVSTLSATIADVAPPTRPQAATLVNTLAPMLGLALGTILSGFLLQAVPDAAADIFLALAIAYLAIGALIWLVPETSARERGWARALIPRAAVPRAARPLFRLSIPIVLAGWATGGLFFSLGPSIVHAELGVESRLDGALVVGVLPFAGALAALALRTRRPLVQAVFGSTALAVGTALMVLALALGSLPLFIVALAVAGMGFGTAFMGTISSLVPLAAVHERAGLFAALYIASYLSFGIPAVVAGTLSSTIGLHATVIGYGVIVALASGIAAVARARAGSARAVA